METNVLKRNENLCYKLGMNFDEANELFGSETLNGMQMVQVNGGAINWYMVGKAVYTAVDFLANCITISSCGGPSASPSTGNITVRSNGDGTIEIETPGTHGTSMDSMIVVKTDSSLVTKIYNFRISSNPTPSGPTYYHW